MNHNRQQWRSIKSSGNGMTSFNHNFSIAHFGVCGEFIVQLFRNNVNHSECMTSVKLVVYSSNEQLSTNYCVFSAIHNSIPTQPYEVYRFFILFVGGSYMLFPSRRRMKRKGASLCFHLFLKSPPPPQAAHFNAFMVCLSSQPASDWQFFESLHTHETRAHATTERGG